MNVELGIIEGFYGKPWTWDEREATVARLAPHGYGCYLYAPRADPHLRRDWQHDHPRDVAHGLARLSARCAQLGVRFGIGVSPYEVRAFGAAEREALGRKLAFFDAIGVRDLAVLFDDMRGDVPGLARPFLWDNYPVNDGQRMSQFVHVRGFTGRPAGMAELVAAHGINPALQPTLSRIPALTLAESYRAGDAYEYGAATLRAAVQVLGDELGARLYQDVLLQDVGLALKHQHARAAPRRQVPRRAGPDHAPAHDHHVVRLHRSSLSRDACRRFRE
jgi:hypothetical protein